MVNIREVSGMFGRDVFTTSGEYCGKIEDVVTDLNKFRLNAVVIDAARGSHLAKIVGGKKGVIVPFQMVNAMGDVVIIKHISGPIQQEEPIEAEE